MNNEKQTIRKWKDFKWKKYSLLSLSCLSVPKSVDLHENMTTMNLEGKINNAIKDAMKNRNKGRLQALRAIKSAILLAKTDSKVHELTEADEMKLLQKLAKQRKDSAAIYQEQGRDELARIELDEAAVIDEYLPKALSEEELMMEIKTIISECGAQSMKDMGKVMGLANQKLAGRADGRTISGMVKNLLS